MDPALITTTLALTATAWLTLVAYSRHRWPYLGCRVCHGTGQVREPQVVAWACLRLERAWRPCDACSGGGKRERPKGLALR